MNSSFAAKSSPNHGPSARGLVWQPLLALAIGLLIVYASFRLFQAYQVWRLPTYARVPAIEETYKAQIAQLKTFADDFERTLEIFRAGQNIGHEALFDASEILSADVLQLNGDNHWLPVRFRADLITEQWCPKSPSLGGARSSYCTVNGSPAVTYESRFSRVDGEPFELALVLDLASVVRK